ncbi:hypothetical protein B0T22DRAFT_68926 [Podospora appendiculata]|uniref:M-phase inducer phosphatase n=1 Tax=Podospora appendiculata TaxID=314037 RepID=A0AAE1CHC8_9PEZI|nr:hypothetical protein B0T22DRAFT_68926 [Podospora appendiculata]
METSSPLAALRPGPASFGGRRDMFGPHLVPNTLGAGSLTMQDVRERFSFQRSHGDYFNLKTIRGSSPAASLAADLSQNFKLNDSSSPLFPTPRRALFTTATMMEAIEGRGKRGRLRVLPRDACIDNCPEYVTTPPLPASSSPGHADMMDMSPLPHKAPFVAQIEIQSPTPHLSPADESMLEFPAPASRQSSLEPPKGVVAERKRLGLRRPSLNRTKGYSTGAIPSRLQSVESQLPPLPPFRFGGDTPFESPSPSLSLSECFADSPPQQRRPQSANSPCPSAIATTRVKSQFASLNNMGGVRNGSPINNHARRTSNPFTRPRKQYRRSLSMFESPGDVMKPKQEEAMPPTGLQSVIDIEEPHEPILPHFFPEGQNDSIPRISRETMLSVLDNKYGDSFSHKMIIDCRFEYEYEGGHIDGAINYNDKELLATHLFRTPMEGRTLIIFHCEYSAHRAPIMARHIRAEDRNTNAEFYPKLTYPEVYILEGGYSGFFEEHRDRCYPQAYVEMNAAEHVNTCEREMGRLRQTRRGGLGRAQTYAFGQEDRTGEDSPTAPGRVSSRDCESMDMIGASPSIGNERAFGRRMVSF